MQGNTRCRVGLLEVALDESKQIWNWIPALLLSLCMWPLAVIGPLAASILPSGKWRYQCLESQQSWLYKSNDISLWKCWALSADSRVTTVPVCLGVNSGLGYGTLSAKTRTVLGKLGWMVITLRAVYPRRRALTQLKQVLQWVMELSFSMVERSLVFFHELIACSILDLWIFNSGLKKVYSLSLFSRSQGVAWNFKIEVWNIKWSKHKLLPLSWSLFILQDPVHLLLHSWAISPCWSLRMILGFQRVM